MHWMISAFIGLGNSDTLTFVMGAHNKGTGLIRGRAIINKHQFI